MVMKQCLIAFLFSPSILTRLETYGQTRQDKDQASSSFPGPFKTISHVLINWNLIILPFSILYTTKHTSKKTTVLKRPWIGGVRILSLYSISKSIRSSGKDSVSSRWSHIMVKWLTPFSPFYMALVLIGSLGTWSLARRVMISVSSSL